MLFRCVRLFCAAFRAEFACIYRTASASPAICRLRLYRLYRLLSVLLRLSRLCAAKRIALWLLRLLWLLIVVVWVLLIAAEDITACIHTHAHTHKACHCAV